MRIQWVLFVVLALVGCAVQPAPATAATLCQAMAMGTYAAQLAGIAAQQNEPASVLQVEFVTACADRITADIQETAADLAGVADGGHTEKNKRP